MKLELSKLQIGILCGLGSRGYETHSELVHALNKSQTRISIALQDLERLGIIMSEKKGLSKRVRLSGSKHVLLLKRLFTKYPNLRFEKYLSGSSVEVLLPLAYLKCNVSEIAEQSGYSERTVLRALNRLIEIGMTIGERKCYSINPRFNTLSEFLREFQAYTNVGLAYEFSKTATILWQRGKEFLIETKGGCENEHFLLTGYEKLGEFGIPLILTDIKHYFYTEYKNRLCLEDMCLHILTLEPASTRPILYVLLAVSKNKGKIDWKYLKKESEKYDLKKIVIGLKKYLKTWGEVKPQYFPTWGEFKTKAWDYDINASEKV